MKKLKKDNAFTLIEILVVATIISLLAAAGIVSYSQFLKQSRDAKRKADLEQIRAALEMYRSNSSTSSYPAGNWSNLSILTAPTVYIQSLPSDPKSPTYVYYYSSNGADYTLAAHLENGSLSACQSLTTQCNGVCNYCLGPYGQK